MSATPEVVVHPNAELLATVVAARALVLLVDAQAARGSASVVLTGGSTGIAVLEQLRSCSARDALDWSRLDVFWGDERFLALGDPERNETQARAALLDHVPIDPRRVFPMAACDSPLGDDPEAAAAAYAATLAGRSTDGRAPRFDLLLLGLGGEGHVASVFPDSAAVHEHERTVVAVRNCPKPPPVRVSLTLPTVRAAAQVWVCVTGAAKADAVRTGLSGASEASLPAAGARGRDRTLWVLDREAASQLPTAPGAP